jgi:superfamily I DNA and/or RNA helicase
MSVDNVLTGLLADGFTNFVRVGSLRAIDKTLLPYTVSGGKTWKDADADTLKELTAMLRENLPAAERSAVEQTIAELRADTGRRSGSRTAKLKEVDVIGVTCLSANSSALDSICADQRPSIVLMDEASQMLEPMSLLALGRFRAARLVAVGDPQQLPPTLHGSASGAEAAAAKVGLGKTLFTRLAPSMPLVMLRTQYRCHPIIAEIVNGLFYNGQLRSAETLKAREPVVPGLAAASFVTTHNLQDCSERQLSSGSFVNDVEARICVGLLQELLRSHGKLTCVPKHRCRLELPTFASTRSLVQCSCSVVTLT